MVVTRKLDDIQRLVISKEVCTEMGWEEKDEIDIITDPASKTVTLKLHAPHCDICRALDKQMIATKKGHICADCLQEAIKVDNG